MESFSGGPKPAATPPCRPVGPPLNGWLHGLQSVQRLVAEFALALRADRLRDTAVAFAADLLLLAAVFAHNQPAPLTFPAEDLQWPCGVGPVVVEILRAEH